MSQVVTEPSTASLYFLAETIPVTLITNGLGSSNDIHLRVGERRLPNNDTEVRIEVSRPDDYRFVFANGITRESFAILRERCNISTDFDSFAKRIVQLIKDREISTPPLRIDCVIDTKNDTCSLELVSQLAVQISKIAIVLRRVVGEELNYHLIDALSRLKKEHRAQLEEERKKRWKFENETRTAADCEVKRLQEEIETLKERVSSLETDCRIEADEKETANSALEDIRRDLNDVECENVELRNEQKVLFEEIDDLRDENDLLVKELEEEKRCTANAEAKAERERKRVEEVSRKLYESNRILKKTLKAVDEEENENEKIENLTSELAKKTETIKGLQNELKNLKNVYQQLYVQSEKHRQENQQYKAQEDKARKLYKDFTPNHFISPITNTTTKAPPTNLVQGSPYSFRQQVPAIAGLPLGTLMSKQPNRNIAQNPLLTASSKPTCAIETPLRNAPQQQIADNYCGTVAKENQIPTAMTAATKQPK